MGARKDDGAYAAFYTVSEGGELGDDGRRWWVPSCCWLRETVLCEVGGRRRAGVVGWMGYKGRVGRVSAGGLTEEKEKRREQASCWAGVFGSKISLGCEENGKRIWNLWLQI
jgi:hypothetical protein